MFLDAIMCKEHTGSSRQSTRAEMQCKPWRFLAPLQVYPSINYRSGAEKSERNGIQCTVQYFGRLAAGNVVVRCGKTRDTVMSVS
jgi:hypothetical protein